jgi:hypothetical protein
MSLILERAPAAVAPSAVCANCGAAGTGDFCPQCGQRRVEDDDLSVRHVAAHVTDALLDVDGRYLTTITLLLTKPGQLTVDYIEGRRLRHVPPLRLFLFVSALYFLSEARPLASSLLFKLTRTPVNEVPEYLFTTFKTAYVASVLVQGAVLWLAFRRVHRYIGAHLVTALHLAAVSMPVMLLFGIIGRWTNLEAKLSGLAAIVLITYANLAFARVYGLAHPVRVGILGMVTHILSWAIPIAATIAAITVASWF